MLGSIVLSPYAVAALIAFAAGQTGRFLTSAVRYAENPLAPVPQRSLIHDQKEPV